MDYLDSVEKISSILSNIFICVGVIIALCQLKNFIVDAEQRKKQATIEFYSRVRNEFIEPLNKIEKLFSGKNVISIDDVKKDDKLNIIKDYLSHMERFSVGINANIYDINVFDRMVGSTLTINWFKRFEEVIHFLRDEQGNPYLYKDLEELVNELKNRPTKDSQMQESDFIESEHTINQTINGDD